MFGVYGDKCDKPCPQNCQERRCDIISGKCLGCLPGWIGDECNEGSSIHLLRQILRISIKTIEE